jgi:MFS family permease
MYVGIGLGGLLGGLVVAVERPESFTVLFLANALSFVAYTALLVFVPGVRPPAREAARYRTVLRNRPFVGFLGLNAVVVGAAIVPMASFLPLFARDEAGASEGEIGLLAFLGGAVIVATQLPIAAALGGRRRMPTLGVMAALWALALLVAAAGGLAGSVPVLAAAAVLFAVGQCLHGAVQNPLTADLAEPGSLGRSMALLNGSWQVGLLVGPIAAGFVFAAEPFALWPLAAAVCVLAAGLALGLDGSVPEPARRTPRRRLVAQES